MAGHFDVTPVVDFVDNGVHIALRGMEWIEAEMPKFILFFPVPSHSFPPHPMFVVVLVFIR